MEHFWFQQDGVPPHTAWATINFLKQLLPVRLMSKNGDFEWPSRSPDLTAPDFFLWGYLKSKVYVNKPRTPNELKTNILQEIAAISAETVVKAMENAAKRALLAMPAQGGHLRDIIFKKWCTQISLNHIKWLLKWTAKMFFPHYWKKNIFPSNMANPVYHDTVE